MANVVRCQIVCVNRKDGKIIGMRIKCPDEDEVYYTIEEIYQLQKHQEGVKSHLPKETCGGITDFYISTIHGGSTLMLVEEIEGELQIINPDSDKIKIQDCSP